MAQGDGIEGNPSGREKQATEEMKINGGQENKGYREETKT